jgi:hypothetical protein
VQINIATSNRTGVWFSPHYRRARQDLIPEPALLSLRLQNLFVAVDEHLVVDADGFKFGRQRFRIGNKSFPRGFLAS